MTLTSEYQYIGRTNAVSCARGYYFRILLYAKALSDTATGKHTVYVKEKMVCDGYSSFYNWPTTGYIKVDGKTASEWNMTPYPNQAWENTGITVGGYFYQEWVDLIETSIVLDTGYAVTKDVVIASSWTLQSSGGADWMPAADANCTANVTVTLPEILGASTISSAEAITLGKACSIKWNPLSASFHYKLKFSIGSWSYTTGIISPKSTTAYTYTGYTFPMEVANQITDGPSGDMKVELFSYLDSSGATQIGSADAETVKATVPDNSDTKPSVSMSLDLVSALGSAFAGLYIQNLTKVSAEISGSGKYGASVEQTRLVIGGAQFSDPCTSGYLTSTGDVTVTGEAVDSRGYVGKTEQVISVIPYSRPTIVPVDGETGIVCARCDSSGNFSDSGTYLRIKAKRSYSPIISGGVQKNFCLIRYRVNGGSWVTILSRTAASDEVDTGAISGKVSSVATAYTIDIGVVDDVGESSYTTIIVPTDEVTFHLRNGGQGAAFGEYSVDEKILALATDWYLNVKGGASVAGAMTVRNPQSSGEALNLGYADGRYLKTGYKPTVKSPLAYSGDTLGVNVATAVTSGSALPVSSGAVYTALNSQKATKVTVTANSAISLSLAEGEVVQISFRATTLTSADVNVKVNGTAPTGAWYYSVAAGTYSGGQIARTGTAHYASWHGFMKVMDGRVYIWGQDFRGADSGGLGQSVMYWNSIAAVTSITFTQAGVMSYKKL